MPFSSTNAAPVVEKVKERKLYPEARVIVLDDDINTYQHVVSSLMKIIPQMNEDKAWKLASMIDSEGSAEVWSGPFEQAELYHHQLSTEGLTMAPLERT